MKARFLLNLILLALVMSVVSCKEGKKGGRNLLPPVSGATNEILVVMNKALWDGPMGDTVKNFFQQPQLGLPQSEPMFDVINLPLANFEKNVKSHRNVLLVEISPRVDTTALLFKDSPWARTQKMFRLTATSDSAFYRLFDENKERIMSVFAKAERDRLIDVYKKTSDNKIFNLFKNKYKMLLYCPGGYIVNKDTNNFVWISAETRVDSKGIIFFQETYENQVQLNYQIIMDRMNEVLKQYIPGSVPNSWMALDMKTPVTAATYNYQGAYYAVMIRGLWNVQNDFMGGPYVINTILDEEHNRIIYMMAYVYAPEGKKRNILRQVENILYTVDIDYEKEGNKNETASAPAK